MVKHTYTRVGPEPDVHSFKIGSVMAPPRAYSPDRRRPSKPVEAWSAGGMFQYKGDVVA